MQALYTNSPVRISICKLELYRGSSTLKMVAYNRCLQISFMLVQVLFLCLGGVMIGVSVWLETEEMTFEAAIDNQELLYGPYLTAAAGSAIILVAIVGVLGACCDKKINRFLLVLYIVLVLVVLVTQLVGGIIGFIYRDMVFDMVQEGLNATLSRYNGDTAADRSITRAWDEVQERLECCGVSSVENWLDQNSTALGRPDGFPLSCCSDGATIVNDTCALSQVYSEGCKEAVAEFVQQNLLLVAAIGLSFLLGEVIVVLMAFCMLCCTDFDDRD